METRNHDWLTDGRADAKVVSSRPWPSTALRALRYVDHTRCIILQHSEDGCTVKEMTTDATHKAEPNRNVPVYPGPVCHIRIKITQDTYINMVSVWQDTTSLSNKTEPAQAGECPPMGKCPSSISCSIVFSTLISSFDTSSTSPRDGIV